MKLKHFRSTDNWDEVIKRGRTAIHKDREGGEITSALKTKLLLAEHSIIRELWIKWLWVEIPYWVTVHFKTHSLGTIQDTRTQRIKQNRGEERQGALVEHEMSANAQAMINISRKRLCNRAAVKTKQAWSTVINRLLAYEPELAKVCVPECVYRGFCPETKCCGYINTDMGEKEREDYRVRG